MQRYLAGVCALARMRYSYYMELDAGIGLVKQRRRGILIPSSHVTSRGIATSSRLLEMSAITMFPRSAHSETSLNNIRSTEGRER